MLRYEKPDRVSVRPYTPFYGSDKFNAQSEIAKNKLNWLLIGSVHLSFFLSEIFHYVRRLSQISGPS